MSQITRGGSRASLFLIELIITIGLFSLSAAVCARLFVSAHQQETLATERTRAVRIAQNAAECFTASRGDPEEFAALMSLSTGQVQDGILREEGLTASFFLSPEDPVPPCMTTLDIQVLGADGSLVYALQVSHYLQRGDALQGGNTFQRDDTLQSDNTFQRDNTLLNDTTFQRGVAP